MYTLFFLMLAPFIASSYLSAEEIFSESFDSLEKWEPYSFSSKLANTQFTLTSEEGNSILQIESSNSASALITKEQFNTSLLKTIAFRWKVHNVIVGADGLTKHTDDFPLRVYLIFDFPRGVSLRSLISLFSDEKFPHSGISYVWSSVRGGPAIFASPYTHRVRIIPLQQGDEKSLSWQTQIRNIHEDYATGFSASTPPFMKIAIMSDTDNTQSWAQGWIDDIRLNR